MSVESFDDWKKKDKIKTQKPQALPKSSSKSVESFDDWTKQTKETPIKKTEIKKTEIKETISLEKAIETMPIQLKLYPSSMPIVIKVADTFFPKKLEALKTGFVEFFRTGIPKTGATLLQIASESLRRGEIPFVPSGNEEDKARLDKYGVNPNLDLITKFVSKKDRVAKLGNFIKRQEDYIDKIESKAGARLEDLDIADDKIGSLLYDVGSGLGSMATAMGLFFITKNKKIAGTTLGVMEGSSTYPEAKILLKENNPEMSSEEIEEKAMVLASWSAIGSAMLETIGLDILFTNFKKGAIFNIVTKFTSEGMQEYSQDLWIDSVTKFGTGELQKKLQGKSKPEQIKILVDNLLKGKGRTFLVGGIVGGTVSSVQEVYKALKKQGVPESEAQNIGKDIIEYIKQAKDEIEIEMESQISGEEPKQDIQSLEDLSDEAITAELENLIPTIKEEVEDIEDTEDIEDIEDTPAKKAVDEGLTVEEFMEGQGTPLYHGGGSDIEIFKDKGRGGVFLTSEKRMAQNHADFAEYRGGKSIVTEARANPKKVYKIQKGTDSFSGLDNNRIIEQPEYYPTEIARIKAKGFDAIQSSDGKQLFVFDAKNIKTTSQLRTEYADELAKKESKEEMTQADKEVETPVSKDTEEPVVTNAKIKKLNENLNEYKFYLENGKLPNGENPEAWNKKFVEEHLIPKTKEYIQIENDRLTAITEQKKKEIAEKESKTIDKKVEEDNIEAYDRNNISKIPNTSFLSEEDDTDSSGESDGQISGNDRANVPEESGDGLTRDRSKKLSKKERQRINEEIESLLESKDYSTSPDIYTYSELELMSLYSGAGGKESVGAEGAGLLNEYYTPRSVVFSMWNIVNKLIPNAETAFEPSAGIGAIISDAPASLNIDGAEISLVSGTIAQILNPDSNITIGDFQELFFDKTTNKKLTPKQYDVVIGNPPFGVRAGFMKGKGEESSINRQEEYFIKRGLDMTNEGGFLVYVVNSSFLKKAGSKGKKAISELGTLEYAFRLPENIFEDTSIGTDIVVFKKKKAQDKISSILRETTLSHDRYFRGIMTKDNVLGKTDLRKDKFGNMESYVTGSLEDAIESLNKKIKQFPTHTLESKTETETETGKKKTTAVRKVNNKNVPDVYRILPKENAQELVIPTQYISSRADINPIEKNMLSRLSRNMNITNVSPEEMPYLNYEEGKYYPDAVYFAENVREKLTILKENKDKIIALLGEDQYNKQLTGIEKSIPKTVSIKEISFEPMDRNLIKTRVTFKRFGQDVELSLLKAFEVFVSVKGNVSFSPFVEATDIIRYINNFRARKDTKSITGEIMSDTHRIFNNFIKNELGIESQKLIEDTYNKEKNSMVLIDYSRLPISVDNMAEKFRGELFEMSPTQKNGISFLVNKRTGLLGWGVGVGKTHGIAIATVINMQKGNAKRAFITVPESTLNPVWIHTLHEMFPTLTINNFHGLQANVVRKLKKERGLDMKEWIKDGEITVITHKGLLRLGLTESEVEESARDLHDALWTEDTKTSRAGEQFGGSMLGIVGSAQKYVTDVMISDLGIDHISVDEVHNFRKIFKGAKPEVEDTVNADGEIIKQKGKKSKSGKRYGNVIGGTPSKQAQQLFLITQYIQKRNAGGNVFLASATAFENHATEVYNILSLIGRDRMKEMRILNINDFFSSYSNFVSEDDRRLDGTWVNTSKMKSFNNILSLQTLVREFIDYQTDPTLIRPDKKVLTPHLKMSDMQEDNLMKIQVLLGVDNSIGSIDETDGSEDGDKMFKENEGSEDDTEKGAFLKASTYSVSNSVSPFFIKEFMADKFGFELPRNKSGNIATPDGFMVKSLLKTFKTEDALAEEIINQSPKIKYSLEGIKTIRNNPKTKDFGSFLYFGKYGVDYHHIIVERIAKEVGYELSEIGVISGKMKDGEKDLIIEKFNSGEIKLLIGGDQTKEGIDLQKNGFATVILALGWNPTEILQVGGRIWRQGNKRSTIIEVYPLVENSGDVTIYNKHEEKGSRINDIFSYTGGSVFDVGEVDPAEKKIALLTNPKDKTTMQIKLNTRELSKKGILLEEEVILYNKINNELSTAKSDVKYYTNQLKDKNLSKDEIKEYKKELIKAKTKVDRMETKMAESNVTDINDYIIKLETELAEINSKIEGIESTFDSILEKFTDEQREYEKKRKTIPQQMGEVEEVIGFLEERTDEEIKELKKLKIEELKAKNKIAFKREIELVNETELYRKGEITNNQFYHLILLKLDIPKNKEMLVEMAVEDAQALREQGELDDNFIIDRIFKFKKGDIQESTPISPELIANIEQSLGLKIVTDQNEFDSKLTEISKLTDTSGRIYGFTDGTNIFLNPQYLSSEVVFHESGHIVWRALNNQNKELTTELSRELKNSKYYKEVVNKRKDITNEDSRIEESFALAMEEYKKRPMSIVTKIKNLLKQAIQNFLTGLGITNTKFNNNPELVLGMKLKDIIQMAGDMLSGGTFNKVDESSVVFKKEYPSLEEDIDESPYDFEGNLILKEMDTVGKNISEDLKKLGEISKDYSIDLRMKDINWLDKLLAQSRDIYLKDKVQFAEADVIMRIGDQRRMKKSVLDNKITKILTPYSILKGDSLKRVNTVLMLGDENVTEYSASELHRKGLDTKEVAGYMAVRKSFNYAFDLLISEMEENGVSEQELMEYKKIKAGYMPHKWKHRFAIKTQVLKQEGLDPLLNSSWTTESIDVFKTKAKQSKEFNARVKNNKGGTFRYIVDTLDSVDVDFFSEQRFSFENMKSIISQAKTGQDVKDKILSSMRDLMKEKGFGRQFIQRKGIKGYEQKEIPKIIADYMSGLSGFVTKMEAGKLYFQSLARIDARRQKDFYTWIRDSIAYDMGQSRELNSLKQVAYVYYLANDLSFLLINMTQNITVGLGELSKLEKGLNKIVGAEIALVKATKDWTIGNLSQDENDAIKGLLAVGALGGEQTSEMTGIKNNPIYRQFGLGLNVALYKSTTFVEQNVNRVPAFLTARRLIAKYNTELSVSEINDQALEVSDDIHFRYGKQHRPALFRGLKSAFFIFNHFIRSYYFLLGRNLKEKQFMAVAKSMFYLALFGGTTGLPLAGLAKIILDVAKDMFGDSDDDETKEELKKWKIALQKGVPAGYLNIDLSGKVGAGIMTFTNIFKDPVDVRSYLGAIGSLAFTRIPVGTKLLLEGRTLEGLGRLLPDFAGNPLRGIYGTREGVYSKYGKPLIDEETNTVFKYTTMEGVLKSIGFTSTRETIAWDKKTRAWKLKDDKSIASGKLKKDIIDAIEEKDFSKARQIERDGVASGVFSENREYVSGAVQDFMIQEMLTEWNSKEKSTNRLNQIEKHIAVTSHGKDYSAIQLTNVKKEFGYRRYFGYNNINSDSVYKATSNKEKVSILKELRVEMGETEFRKLFELGRKKVIYESGRTGYVLISDEVNEMFFKK